MAETGNVIRPFLVGLSIYSLFGLSVLGLMGKAEAHLWLNGFAHPWADTFFRYFTETANGIIPVIATHVLIFVRYSWALAMGASAISMGIIVQWLKRGVFDLPRPAGFFENGMLRTIDGLERASHFSFPSGHSATAFCMFLMFALLVKKPWTTYLFIVWAILAAYSRVYISQHFIEDTIAGAWIGVGTTLLSYHFIVGRTQRNPESKLNGRLWP